MKLLINCILVLGTLLPGVYGQGTTQVDYSAAFQERTVYLNAATAVANGNSVWLGAFNTGYTVANNIDNPQSLLANWNEYDRTTITSQVGPFTQPGSFIGSGQSGAPVFENKSMYLWIFSTDDGLAPQANWANVDAYGLFTSNDPDWVFPALNDPFPRQISTDDTIQTLRGSVDGLHLYLAAFSPVPEPSTVALLSIGIPAVVLALRKRRHRE